MSEKINECPTDEELSNALSRYNLIVKGLEIILNNLEESNKNDQRWFTFSGKIGKKFLAQALTLQHIFSYETYLLIDGDKKRTFDISSVDSLLRVQLETFAVFFHLFIDKCDMSEKIVRFRLWELDGLRNRNKFISPENPLLIANANSISECIAAIEKTSYFKKLDNKTQNILLKDAIWKFTDESLKSKKSKRISIERMIMRTGLNLVMFDNLYSFASTHSHTLYWSVVQNNTLTVEEKITAEYVSLMEASFICSFFIKDLCQIFTVTKETFSSLPINNQEIINYFNTAGRIIA